MGTVSSKNPERKFWANICTIINIPQSGKTKAGCELRSGFFPARHNCWRRNLSEATESRGRHFSWTMGQGSHGDGPMASLVSAHEWSLRWVTQAFGPELIPIARGAEVIGNCLILNEWKVSKRWSARTVSFFSLFKLRVELLSGEKVSTSTGANHWLRPSLVCVYASPDSTRLPQFSWVTPSVFFHVSRYTFPVYKSNIWTLLLTPRLFIKISLQKWCFWFC